MGGYDSGDYYDDDDQAAEEPQLAGLSELPSPPNPDLQFLRDDEAEAVTVDAKEEELIQPRAAVLATKLISVGIEVTVRAERGRPAINALGLLLPAQDRERWTEEWMAEWVDLGSRPLRTQVAFLLRVALRSGPHLAWTLRQARRQRAG
ncbi:hypothetical protein [Streptomyces sp. NPDC058678]|uniref:hypothetical protein n=1 Tax=Streptomyces sp. NPDC058678 TaxID=3346595 RepID=UPI003669B994